MALPTTNLAARYIAGTGITEADAPGRVSAWADQSGNGHHLTQTTPSAQPYAVTRNGSAAVQIVSGTSMVIPSSLTMDARSITVWIVTEGAMGTSAVTISGYAFGAILRLNSGATVVSHLRSAGYTSTAVKYTSGFNAYGVASAWAQVKLLSMDEVSTHGNHNTGSGTGGGLACLGYIREFLIYSAQQSDSDIAATREYFEDTYGLRGHNDEWSGHICCEGDSITAGAGLTEFEDGYPRQLADLIPLWKVRSFATTGATVSTLTSRAASVDTAIDSGLSSNILMVLIGRNDLGTLSAADFYSALVTYVAARVAAGWTVWVGTLIATGSSLEAKITESNQRIRGTNGYTGIIADAGAAKVVDFAASPYFDETADSNNTTYYQGDNTHLTEAGCGLLADIVSDQFVAAPTVTTTAASNITGDTAILGGNVTSDGGASVTDRGVCWNTSENPTYLDGNIDCGSGTGSFSAMASGMAAGTTYYARAWADNSEGISYGDNVTFTTLSTGRTLRTIRTTNRLALR